MPPSPSKPKSRARIEAYLGGHRGEALAAWFLRLKLYRIIGRRYEDGTKGLVVLRPEHLEVDEAPDGPADPGAWRVLRRRFTGTEILYEVGAADGARLWVEAGHAVRRLRLGDAVRLRVREIETVMFSTGHGAHETLARVAGEWPASTPLTKVERSG